MVVKILS